VPFNFPEIAEQLAGDFEQVLKAFVYLSCVVNRHDSRAFNLPDLFLKACLLGPQPLDSHIRFTGRVFDNFRKCPGKVFEFGLCADMGTRLECFQPLEHTLNFWCQFVSRFVAVRWLKPMKVCVFGIRPFRQIFLCRPAADEIAGITQFFDFGLKQCAQTTFRRNRMMLALEGGE